MNMTDDQIEDIQDQLQNDWDVFRKSHDWKSETEVINPKCDDCTQCKLCCEQRGIPKTCYFEIIDGARIGYRLTDGGFLYPALKSVCETYNLHHPTFEERFEKSLQRVELMDDMGSDFGAYECNGVVQSDAGYFVSSYTDELIDELVSEVISGFSLRNKNKDAEKENK